jgi:hypothetical protein
VSAPAGHVPYPGATLACEDCESSYGWHEHSSVTSLSWMILGLWCLVLVLLLALVRRNVIAWADLLPAAADG